MARPCASWLLNRGAKRRQIVVTNLPGHERASLELIPEPSGDMEMSPHDEARWQDAPGGTPANGSARRAAVPSRRRAFAGALSDRA